MPPLLSSIAARADTAMNQISQGNLATTWLRRRVGEVIRGKVLSRQEKLARPEIFELPTTWFVVGGSENLGQDDERR